MTRPTGPTDPPPDLPPTADRVRELEAELAAAQRRAREALDALEAARGERYDLLVAASHELRGPLNAILGWAQMLGSGSLPPERLAQGAEVIARNARAQSELISEIVEFARASSGRLDLQLGLASLRALVEEAVAAEQAAAERAGVTLALTCDGDGEVSVDAERMAAALGDLVGHAVRGCEAGDQVDIRLIRDPAGWRVDVSGSGIDVSGSGSGVPADRRGAGFGLLPKEDRRRGSDDKLGLGLARVRALIAAHGGSVSARGATRSILLSSPDGAAVSSPD